LAAHLSPGSKRQLVDGCLLKAGYTAYWKRDLTSAQYLFRKALFHGCWHLEDAKYLLPSLLPEAAYRTLIAAVDRR